MYYLLTIISVFFQFLPRKLVLSLGRTIGISIYHLYPLRKSIASSNLEIAFPEYSLNKRISILKECYKHYGMVFVDFFSFTKN